MPTKAQAAAVLITGSIVTSAIFALRWHEDTNRRTLPIDRVKAATQYCKDLGLGASPMHNMNGEIYRVDCSRTCK